MFTAALFKIAKKWKQFKCPSTATWTKENGTWTQWNTTQP
jgi:hypothetical protein